MNLKVVYRLTDISSSNPSPIYWDNKLRLNMVCLASFIEAFREVNPKVYMICDRCPEFYATWIKSMMPFDMDIEFTNSGIRENAVHQYDYVKDDDMYLFQECDYLYLPHTGQSMVDAAQVFDFITPYDHPDKYKEGMIPKEHDIKIVNGKHWRSTDSTTSTFMARGSKFKEQEKLFREYGWDDHKRWLDLGTRGYTLWSPIESIATHMVSDYMASSIDWKSIWEKYI